MSTLPENEFDLEKLFLPAWAQEDPSASAKYAKYEGEQERTDRRGDRRGPRPPRRFGEGGPGNRGDRPRGPRRPGRPEGAPGQRGPRPGGERFQGRRPEGRERERERREPPPPLPELDLMFIPDEKGVESLSRQIKMTGRAYPLFDIAQMILQKPERHAVVFKIRKKPDGTPAQPLFLCALDDTLWLSEDEAVSHVLRKHFGTFYQAERTPTEPPKGKYTFVAQCGFSGIVLGPPNYHDYQNQLRRLHAERFSRMPFEAYKARVKIVRDEAVVKKWVEDQSFKTDYTCLNVPEPLRLPNMEAVEKHFRETHKESIIKQVESHTLSGQAARNLRSHELTRAVRVLWEDQKRFPLQIATSLSQQFAARGLQFFKVNKTVTHVCVARPHYLDLAASPVSDGVKRIVEYINTHPRCTRKELVEALAPTPPAPPPAPLPVGEAAAAGSQPPAAAIPDPTQPTAEQTTVIADLHWLIHQGHVIEFATGILETAKKPAPKPPKPEPKKPAATEQPAPAVEGAETAATAPAEAEFPAPAAEAPSGGSPAPTAAQTETATEPGTEQTSGEASSESAAAAVPEPAPVVAPESPAAEPPMEVIQAASAPAPEPVPPPLPEKEHTQPENPPA